MHIRRMLPVVLLALLVISGPTAMAAKSWRSSSNPLTAYQDGVAQGVGYGTFEAAATSSGGVKVSNAGWLKDYKPGGDGIFHNTKYSLFTCSTGCNPLPGAPFQSSRHFTNVWTLYTPSRTHDSVVNTYHWARGAIIVCEDHNLAPDSCSTQVVTGYDYF